MSVITCRWNWTKEVLSRYRDRVRRHHHAPLRRDLRTVVDGGIQIGDGSQHQGVILNWGLHHGVTKLMTTDHPLVTRVMILEGGAGDCVVKLVRSY